MTQPWINDKKATCSNSSLNSELIELQIEKKYGNELILVKSYKKDLIFLVAKTLKDITYHTLKVAKVFSQQ